MPVGAFEEGAAKRVGYRGRLPTQVVRGHPRPPRAPLAAPLPVALNPRLPRPLLARGQREHVFDLGISREHEDRLAKTRSRVGQHFRFGVYGRRTACALPPSAELDTVQGALVAGRRIVLTMAADGLPRPRRGGPAPELPVLPRRLQRL
jgi:hypothetical protein